jgi:hypothetical protein
MNKIDFFKGLIRKVRMGMILGGWLCGATVSGQTWNCGDPNVNDGKNVTATLDDGTLTNSETGALQFYCPKKLFFTNY